jgi:hypothetical protein
MAFLWERPKLKLKHHRHFVAVVVVFAPVSIDAETIYHKGIPPEDHGWRTAERKEYFIYDSVLLLVYLELLF